MPVLDERSVETTTWPLWVREHGRVVAGPEQHVLALREQSRERPIRPNSPTSAERGVGLDRRHGGHPSAARGTGPGGVARTVGCRDRSTARPSKQGSPDGCQAYILIQTDVGKAADVAKAIADINGVTLAEDVTGPYDVIVRAEARNVDELGKLVVAKVQTLDGITRTLTCPVVHI